MRPLVFSLLIAVSGCSAPQRDGAFELRDFAISKDGDSRYSTIHVGRGTLVSDSPHLKDVTALVYLEMKYQQGTEPEGTSNEVVTLRDGVGQVHVTYFATEARSPAPRVISWTVTGYTVLEPGTLTVR